MTTAQRLHDGCAPEGRLMSKALFVVCAIAAWVLLVAGGLAGLMS